MSDPRRLALLACTLILAATPRVQAQGTRADYERADALAGKTRDKVVGGHVQAHWLKGGSRFWYRRDLADGAREFIAVDAEKGVRAPAFDHAKLAEALAKATGKAVKPTHLPVDWIGPFDEDSVKFEALGKTWLYDTGADVRETAEPLDKDDPAPPEPRRRRSDDLFDLSLPKIRHVTERRTDSPDGKRVVFLKGPNIFLRDKATGDEFALSDDGDDENRYEPAVFWSPDSKKLVALRTTRGDDRKVHLVESSPRDRVQPKLDSYEYLKPGDRISVSKPRLFDVAERKPIPVSDDLFKTPWSIDNFRWSDDSSRFRFVYNQRGHQVVRVVSIDAATGAASTLIGETSPTFVDYSQKTYGHELVDSHEILWMSERDGWNHLYLFDAETGRLKNRVTKGEWVVRKVVWVDEENRQVWFGAMGIRPGQDPYHVHFARVNLDGSGLVVLTEGDGTHDVTVEADRKYLIDTYSRVDMPPVVELRSAETGALVCELERADASALIATGWRAPERFAAKGRDGKTEIYGVIYRPTTFDPSKKYPVIEEIYAGPHGSNVPKKFAAHRETQSLAELGFVVVQVDGMGTNWRSKAFHDVCWKNLGDAGFPDRILWLKAAAAQRDPALDLTRVGIYGGSAGGQNALGALLFHGDFYRAAVADCGCHDNRMDKIWWNEAWMGWPVGPEYAAASNVTNAYKLKGKLLLTVGELDRNVDPASTMQVVNALIRAGKDFDLVVFPGAGHGAGSSKYGERRKRDFFVKHLLGVEPPDRNGDRTD